MKKAVTIAQKKDGKWVTLAHPDTPIHEQKAAFKKMKAEGSGEYMEAIILFTPGKRYRFDSPKKKLVPTTVDDLSNKAEAELKEVIKKESLKVKFSEDHEKTRDLIRKAREEGAKKGKKGKKGKKDGGGGVTIGKPKEPTPKKTDGAGNEKPRGEGTEETKESVEEK